MTNTATLLQRFYPDQKCEFAHGLALDDNGHYSTERHIDTVEFTCSFGDEIDARFPDTREYIYKCLREILKPYFKQIAISSNKGSTLIAHDLDKYIFVIIERCVGKCVARVQLKGRFYNVGKYLNINTMGYTQEILRDLDGNFNLPMLAKKPIWKMKQFDICQDFKGYDYSSLVKNYHYVVNGKKERNRLNLIDSKIKYHYKNDNDLKTLETVYLNLKCPKGRVASLSLKIYKKLEHLRSEYKQDAEYFHWYRDNFDRSEHVTRVEMSFKSPKECSGILEYIRRANRNGECIDESEMCLSVLGSVYKGNKLDGRSKGHALKLTGYRGGCDGLMKFFCTEKGVTTEYIGKLKEDSMTKLTIDQKLNREISKLENKFIASHGKDDLYSIVQDRWMNTGQTSFTMEVDMN